MYPAPAYIENDCMGVGYLFIRNLKVFILIFSVLFLFSGCTGNKNIQKTLSEFPANDIYDTLKDSASAAILFCPDTKEVIYGHNINDKKEIASITKIMTAVIGLEFAKQNDKNVTVTEQMYAEGSSMYLKKGEMLKLSAIISGMMAVSGNDAANAVAVTVGGSVENFASMMNRKAELIGMKNSHFVTPSGLDAEGHYSTAYDMALLCAYAMNNKDFVNIVSKKNIKVDYIEPEGKTQMFTNHNKLLSICEGCIGIKTGFTKKAGRTLTSCVSRGGKTLVCVTLNDGNDWQDHINLYNYGFDKVNSVKPMKQPIKIYLADSAENDGYVNVITEDAALITVKKGNEKRIIIKYYVPPFLYSPVNSGDEVGTAKIFFNGKEIMQKRLIAQ